MKRRIKTNADTNPGYGCDPQSRSVEKLRDFGIVVIDKPSGPTSHQVSAYVQNILEIKKAGHSGTLDPKVTGVLPVALGRGTKVVQALLGSKKEYVCLMHIHDKKTKTEIKQVIASFVGTITQLPPVKSAVKRQKRDREIYYIDVHEIDDQDVLFTVGCEAGTYIRKLVHDIGQKLGCGAHMAELRRTKAGPFDETKAVTLQDLTDAYHYAKDSKESFIKKIILPIETGVSHLKKIWLLDQTINTICNGATLKVPGIHSLSSDIKKGDVVALMSLKDELVALGNATMTSDEIMGAQKGIAVKTDAVFMKPNTYPALYSK